MKPLFFNLHIKCKIYLMLILHELNITYLCGVVFNTAITILTYCIQTSIMAVEFNGGVVMGADSRTTTGLLFIFIITNYHMKTSPYFYSATLIYDQIPLYPLLLF